MKTKEYKIKVIYEPTEKFYMSQMGQIHDENGKVIGHEAIIIVELKD